MQCCKGGEGRHCESVIGLNRRVLRGEEELPRCWSAGMIMIMIMMCSCCCPGTSRGFIRMCNEARCLVGCINFISRCPTFASHNLSIHLFSSFAGWDAVDIVQYSMLVVNTLLVSYGTAGMIQYYRSYAILVTY